MERQEQLISKHNTDPDPNQPRKHFDEKKLEELRDSILAIGLQNPIVVLPKGDGRFQIVTGERRWRAFMMIDDPACEHIRAFVVSADTKALLWQMAENLQREGLNSIEEARGYQRLLEEQTLSQEKVAAAVGKSSPYISRSLMLLRLPESVQELVAKGSLKPVAARMLVARCATKQEMTEVIDNLRKQRQGIKKITQSAIATYLDARGAPKHLRPRAPKQPVVTAVNGADRESGAERFSEVSAMQRFISGAGAFANELGQLAQSKEFPRMWQCIERRDQIDLIQVLVRVSRHSRELQQRAQEVEEQHEANG